MSSSILQVYLSEQRKAIEKYERARNELHQFQRSNQYTREGEAVRLANLSQLEQAMIAAGRKVEEVKARMQGGLR